MKRRIGKSITCKLLGKVASFVTVITAIQANSMCWFLMHQEKLPKEAEKFKRK